jgi:hypothetical protein
MKTTVATSGLSSGGQKLISEDFSPTPLFASVHRIASRQPPERQAATSLVIILKIYK